MSLSSVFATTPFSTNLKRFDFSSFRDVEILGAADAIWSKLEAVNFGYLGAESLAEILRNPKFGKLTHLGISGWQSYHLIESIEKAFDLIIRYRGVDLWDV